MIPLPDTHAASTRQLKALMDNVWRLAAWKPQDVHLMPCGGRTLRLICSDGRLQDKILPALCIGAAAEPAGFEILALTGAQTPMPPWNLPHTDERHLERMHLSLEDGFAAHFDMDRTFWAIWDRASARGLFWIENPADVPAWDEAAPLRTMLNWSMAHTDAVMLHGGAAGGTRAALLVGPSGSGKSTTVGACALSGMTVYGDDLVVAERQASGYVVHALYDAIKLDPNGPLKTKVDFAAMPGRHYDGKLHMRLSQVAPNRLAHAAPLAAVVRPVVAHRPESAIVPESKAAMLRALGPPTAFLLRGFEQPALTKIAALVRDLPCYRMELSDDPFEAAGILSAWLERGP